VDGRPLLRLDFGTNGKPVVLLTAAMHGVEIIGALALLDLLERLGDPSDTQITRLLAESHIVVMPIVNPDALSANLVRVELGQHAWQRCNASGVDLNRNFPRQTTERLYHPFSGSRFKLSPHYLGPHALSEPESRAVAEVARLVRPAVSLAFHSFGNVLLYPWAHTQRPNPRAREYLALGAALTGALTRAPYLVRQARQLYAVLGDMDDWLDAELGTLAFTVEVSRPDVCLREGPALANPFRWMNPGRVRETVENLTPGVLALLARALGLPERGARGTTPAERPSPALEFAAQ